MAHRIVGLDIGPDGVKATFAETSFRAFKVVECREIPRATEDEFASLIKMETIPETTLPAGHDVEDTGTEKESSQQAPLPPYAYAVAKFLKSPGVHFNEASVTLPGSMISNRIIELPFTDVKRIEQVLAIEMENHVPFDLDLMMMSYQIIERTTASSKLLVSLAKKSDVSTFLDNMERAGLDPTVIDIGPNAIANAANLRPDEQVDNQLILHIGAKESSITLMQKGIMTGLRTIPLGLSVDDLHNDPPTLLKSLIQQIRQTLKSIQMGNGSYPTNLLLAGTVATDISFRQQIAKSLDMEVDLFAPFAGSFEKTVDDDDATNATFAKSLGLALRLTHVAKKGQINFRTGEFSYRRAGGLLKKELKRIVIMGGILLVLLMYNLIHAHIQNSREAEQIRQQIVQVFNENFPGQRVLNPVEQFRQNMEQVYKKYKVVGFLGDGDLRAIEILKNISETLPKTVKIDIKRLDIQQDRITLDGVTDNFELVDKIEAALRKFKGFKQIKKDTATKTANEAIKFKFSIRISEKSETGGLTGRRSLLKGGE